MTTHRASKCMTVAAPGSYPTGEHTWTVDDDGTDADCTSAMIDSAKVMHVGTSHNATASNLDLSEEYRFRVRAVGIPGTGADNALKVLTGWAGCEAVSTTARSVCRAATGIEWTQGTHACRGDAAETNVLGTASLTDGSGLSEGVRASRGTATLACGADGWADEPTNKVCAPSPNLCPSDGWHRCAAARPSGWANSTNAGHFCANAGDACFELPLPPPPVIGKASHSFRRVRGSDGYSDGQESCTLCTGGRQCYANITAIGCVRQPPPPHPWLPPGDDFCSENPFTGSCN